MRIFLVLLASTSLAACGGQGVQSVGSKSTSSSGTAVGGAVPTSGHTFVTPTEPKTYSAIGGVQSFAFSNNTKPADVGQPYAGSPNQQYGQLYAANASTARNSGITVTYNPRDAIFDVLIKDGPSFTNDNLRFQDPLHRTDFGGAKEPQGGVPDLTIQGVQYLQAGGGSEPPTFDTSITNIIPVGPSGLTYDKYTFFYQKPGTLTKYVTFAGFVRNQTVIAPLIVPGSNGLGPRFTEYNSILERGAFVFGERTTSAAVPKLGSATYTGPMLASMIFNDQADVIAKSPSYFQWIIGNASTALDFAANTFKLDLTGKVTAPEFDINTSHNYTLLAGADFFAKGSGRVDLVNAGGFLGNFSSAYFVQPTGTRVDMTIGGSSIDGAFFGPNGEEIGGGFRIVGGNPDERVDILGAFTGKK